MNDSRKPVSPEDYVEPRCVLGGDPYGKTPEVIPVPQQRIIAKANEHMNRRDYAAVERHLNYWLEEARLGHDLRGELTIRNELIGHYRKSGCKEPAYANIEEALKLIGELSFDGTVSGATTYVNCGTACNAFGDNERSVELFEKARNIYESIPGTDPALLGGLYNNMALACADLGRFEEAEELYQKALQQMGSVPDGVLEQAITLLNLADVKEAESGYEAAESEITALLDRAYEMLENADVPHDGYYAFVCEKCAPTFSYYGYFSAAQELENRAKEIYERA